MSGTPPSDEEPKGPYPTVITNPSGSETLVVQDFTWGKYLGQLNVEFDGNGDVVSYTGNPILLDSSVAEGKRFDIHPGPEFIKVFLSKTQSSMKFQLLITIKIIRIKMSMLKLS